MYKHKTPDSDAQNSSGIFSSPVMPSFIPCHHPHPITEPTLSNPIPYATQPPTRTCFLIRRLYTQLPSLHPQQQERKYKRNNPNQRQANPLPNVSDHPTTHPLTSLRRNRQPIPPLIHTPRHPPPRRQRRQHPSTPPRPLLLITFLIRPLHRQARKIVGQSLCARPIHHALIPRRWRHKGWW